MNCVLPDDIREQLTKADNLLKQYCDDDAEDLLRALVNTSKGE